VRPQLFGLQRRLYESYPHMILDARYEKAREAGVIVGQGVLVALAVDESVAGRN
jgi:putative transposase